MNEYLKSISNIADSSTSVSLSSLAGDDSPVLELPERPPSTTSSSMVENETQPLLDNAQYLSPQKIKLRKYTLKKG